MADLKLNNVTTLTESGGGVAGTFSNVTASGNVTVSGDLVPSEPLSHRNMIYNGECKFFKEQLQQLQQQLLLIQQIGGEYMILPVVLSPQKSTQWLSQN